MGLEHALNRILQSEKEAVETRNSELLKCLDYYGITPKDSHKELPLMPNDQEKDQQIAKLQQRVREDQAKQVLV